MKKTTFLLTLLAFFSFVWADQAAAQELLLPADLPDIPADVRRHVSRNSTPIAASSDVIPIVCPFDYEGTRKIECGTLIVPESRRPMTADSTNAITLTYAIMRSPNPASQPDPIFYINGGPGSHTLDRMADWEWRFDIFLPQRDVIFLEIRGISYSDTSPVADLNRLAYRSTEIAADVHDLVTALDIEQVNLFGISYGTRIAQTIMRDYPAIVRSAMLDGVVPIALDLFGRTPSMYDHAFERFITTCEQAPQCADTYPDLRAQFLTTLDMLHTNPVIINDFYDPFTTMTTTITIDDDFLFVNLFQMMYSTYNLPDLHSHLNDAVNGDYTEFILNHLRSNERRSMFLNSLANWTISCNDYGTLFDLVEQTNRLTAIAPELAAAIWDGDYAAVCESILGVSAEQLTALSIITETIPISSDIPTLLTSGSLDPVTPPRNAEAVATHLKNSYDIVFPDMGHSVIGYDDCPDSVFTQFIKSPDQAPNSDCISGMSRLFSETYTVMMPLVFR